MEHKIQYISLQHIHKGGILFFCWVDGLVVLLRQDISNFVLCDIVETFILFEKQLFHCSRCLVYQICTFFLNFIFSNWLQDQDILQLFVYIGLLANTLQSLRALSNKIRTTKVPVHVKLLFAQILWSYLTNVENNVSNKFLSQIPCNECILFPSFLWWHIQVFTQFVIFVCVVFLAVDNHVL